MKVKSDKLKEILTSSGLAVGLLGITISTLPKMTVKTENNTIPNTAVTDALNDDIPENIQTLLEKIRTYQDETLDNEDARTTPGLDGEIIRYHEKIVNPDQSITYMYNNECVKKVSRYTVWFKTDGGSKCYRINNSIYLLPNQATISVVTKRYDDKQKELYRMDGTYTVSEIKDDEERITELRKKDGRTFKYYYDTWISSIEEAKSIPDHYDTTFHKAQVVINPDGSLLYIQANNTFKGSSEHFILYPDGKSRIYTEYEKGNGTKSTTYEINKGSQLVEKYEDGELKEKYENGRRYFFNIYGQSYYEIKSSIGTTRYTLDDIKYEFVDNEGNITEYDKEENVIEVRTVDGKITSYYLGDPGNKIKYESDKTKSIYYDKNGRITETQTSNKRIVYHENDQIKFKFEEYDDKTGKYMKAYQYTRDGHLISYKEDNVTEWYNYDGSLFGRGIDDQIEINYPGSDKPMVRIYGTTVKFYYEQNGNKSREIWNDSIYSFNDVIRYNSEKNEYELNEFLNSKTDIKYYPSGNMQSAKYINTDNYADYTYVEYYDAPQRKSITTYAGGKLKESHEYWEGGQLKKHYNAATNYDIEYYDGGILKYEGNPVHGEYVNGVYKESGGEYEKANHDNGNLHYQKSRQNGNIYEEYHRIDGSTELIRENDTRTYFDTKERLDRIETPDSITRYDYYSDFIVCCTYDKTEGTYDYYYNDELIYSGNEKLDSPNKIWHIDETGNVKYTAMIYSLPTGERIIIDENGVSREETIQK